MNKIIERIALSKMQDSFLKVISHLEKNALIILDDFGLQPLDAIMDRLVSNAVHRELNGESIR